MKLVFPIAAGALLVACSSPPEGEFSRAEKSDAHHSAEWAMESASCRQHLKTLEALRDRMLVAQTAELRDAIMKAIQRPEQAEADEAFSREVQTPCRMDVIDLKIELMMQFVIGRDAVDPAPR